MFCPSFTWRSCVAVFFWSSRRTTRDALAPFPAELFALSSQVVWVDEESDDEVEAALGKSQSAQREGLWADICQLVSGCAKRCATDDPGG